MPLTEIYCAAPKHRRSDTKFKVTIPTCLDCAHTRENDCHFTYELLASMYATVQDRGSRISTTTLTSKCMRSEFFKRTEEYAEKPESIWASFRGTMYHGQLEKFAAPGSIEEARYGLITDQGPLTGSPDLLDVRMGILYDYKVTKEVPRFNYPWEDHVAQMNVNRWLVDNAWWVEYKGEYFLLDVSRETQVLEHIDGFVNTNVRENVTRFRPTIWNELVLVYMDDKGPKPIACTRSIDVAKADGNGTKKQRVPDIWGEERVTEYITTRYAAAKDALEAGNMPPIPEAFAGWTHPLCAYCPKQKECIDAFYKEGI